MTQLQPGRRAARGRGGASGPLANTLLAHLPIGIAVIDADTRLSYWNEQAATLFGVPPMLSADAPLLADMLAGVDGLDQRPRDQIVSFAAAHIQAGDRTEPESWLRISLGRNRAITIQAKGIGSRRWMLLFGSGFTSALDGRHGLAQGEVWLDPLTGLRNRRHFDQALRTLVDNATTTSRHALLMIDLDRFRLVNETFGRPVGDAMLCLVAQRLRRETRDDDLLVRLDGDVFVVLLTNVAIAEALAARIIESLSRPFVVEGQTVQISACAGIVCFPDHGPAPDDLMRNVHLALRDAKAARGQQ